MGRARARRPSVPQHLWSSSASAVAARAGEDHKARRVAPGAMLAGQRRPHSCSGPARAVSIAASRGRAARWQQYAQTSNHTVRGTRPAAGGAGRYRRRAGPSGGQPVGTRHQQLNDGRHRPHRACRWRNTPVGWRTPTSSPPAGPAANSATPARWSTTWPAGWRCASRIPSRRAPGRGLRRGDLSGLRQACRVRSRLAPPRMRRHRPPADSGDDRAA